MRRETVSVLVNNFNYGEFVSAAIDSALSQGQDVEVIVVDDGSTDDGAAVAARYAPRVRCLRQPNRGLSAARNAGLQAARGTWITFLDGDDRLWPESVVLKSIPVRRLRNLLPTRCQNRYARCGRPPTRREP